MRLYLAGPMSGYPDQNCAAFDEAAQLLRRLGHEVWSPAEKDRENGFVPGRPETLSLLKWDSVMREDLQQVLACDGVVFLDGWFRSNGARLERIVAESTGRVCYRLRQTEDGFGWDLQELPPWDHEAIYRMGQEASYGSRRPA